MPWEHCDATLLDDQVCPTCGTSKAQWTLTFQTTRTFKLSRRPTARFVVFDGEAEGEAVVPGVGWRATLPGGAVASGETDELGTARAACDAEGEWTLELPEVHREDLLGVEPEPVSRGDDHDVSVRLRLLVGRRYQVRIRPGLVMHLTHEGRPLAGRRYRLVLGDDEDTGTTDAGGGLRATIPGDLARGELFVEDGAGGELHLPLRFGRLEPADGVRGAQQRLNNLGFACGLADGELGARTVAALQRFQRARGLPATGELDEATRRALRSGPAREAAP